MRATTRRELIDLLQAERALETPDRLFSRFEFSAASSLGSAGSWDELLLVWQEDPRDAMTLPNLIVTEPTDQRDFFAWAATYVHGIRPLTAFMRVYDRKVAQQVLEVQNPPTLHRLENACVGLILAETATYLSGQKDLKEIPAKACFGTHSFVMARSLAMGTFGRNSDGISDAWFEARELTHQSSLPLDRLALRRPWQILLGLEPGRWPTSLPIDLPRPIFEACLDLYLKGEVDKRQWYALDAEIPGIAALGDLMRGPREDRVLALDEAMGLLRSKTRAGQTMLTFVIGYLTSQIAPGTLDHLHLLRPLLRDFPDALLWYGLCAGLHKRSTVISYASGLGRRVLREVLRTETVMDRPTCDVAVSELQILRPAGKSGLDFLTSSNSQIDVEIAPCITSTLRWPPKPDFQEQIFTPAPNEEEIRDIQFELDTAARLLHGISARIHRMGEADGTKGKVERKQRRR